MLRVIVISALILIFQLPNLYSQTRTIARLKEQIQKSSSSKNQLATILALCNQGNTLPPDTLMSYALAARTISKKVHDFHAEIEALYYQSFAYTNKGLLDSSLAIADRCISLLTKRNTDYSLMANLLNQKGRCFVRKNQYKDAINMGYQVIENTEKANDTLLQIKGKTLIGWAYLEMNQLKDALNWHLNALHTSDNEALLEKYGILFANLALNYNSLGKLDSGVYYIDKAILYSRKNENLFALSNSLAIKAQFLATTNNPAEAENLLKEVVAIRKQIGDPFYIVSDMCQLGIYYAHNNQPAKGIAICNEGLAIAGKYKIDTKLYFLYSTLAENYKVAGDIKSYAQQLQNIIAWKDSVYSINSAESLAELQTKYELEKKENLIIAQQANLFRQQLLFWALLVISVLSGIILLLLFIGYKKRQKLKLQLLMQEEKRLSSEAVYKAKEVERLRISRDLHDSMGAYVSAISANVDELMLQAGHDKAALEKIKSNAGDLMMNLRDTIWVLNKNSISLTGISDRFKLFIQKIGESYPQVKIQVHEDISKDITLTPEQSINILHILQEGLNNALKHSNASAISVCIISKEYLKITLTDNGSGFNSSIIHKGQGIDNMWARAKESGLKLRFISKEPSGAEMVLTQEGRVC